MKKTLEKHKKIINGGLTKGGLKLVEEGQNLGSEFAS